MVRSRGFALLICCACALLAVDLGLAVTTPTPSWSSEADQAGALWGTSAAGGCDVNGDGFEDLVIGAPSYDSTPNDEGVAFAFYGSSSGLSTTPDWSAEGNQFEAEFAVSVACAGDTNGDGYDDVLVGAPGVFSGSAEAGAAYLYRGSVNGLALSPSWTDTGGKFGVRYGTAVAGLGDVDGDGFDDIGVGAPDYYGTTLDEGRVWVYLGSVAGPPTRASWTMEGGLTGSGFGASLAGAGDVNGDGFDDLLVGAPDYTNGESREGRVFLYLGSPSGPEDSPAWTAESDQADAAYGHALAGAGDINGDGYDEIAIGVPYFDGASADAGRVDVYAGGPAGPAASPSWSFDGTEAGALLGSSVWIDADIDGDGFADLLVGSPLADNEQIDEGMVFLFTGTSEGLRFLPDGSADSGQTESDFGRSLAVSDVNDDGRGDLLVGAPMLDNGEEDEGAAFLYEGMSSGGCLVTDDDADGLTGCGGDNCPRISNPGQEDFDGDDIGDVCEVDETLADIDNSHRVDGFDLAILSRGFGTQTPDAAYDARADLDRNGTIDGMDLSMLAASFGKTVL